MASFPDCLKAALTAISTSERSGLWIGSVRERLKRANRVRGLGRPGCLVPIAPVVVPVINQGGG
jgi:hypothetical protein